MPLPHFLFFFFTTFSVSICCQWTFKLFPHTNYCEQCCNKQLDLLISSSKRILGWHDKPVWFNVLYPNLYLQKALISKLSSSCGPHRARNCSDIVPWFWFRKYRSPLGDFLRPWPVLIPGIVFGSWSPLGPWRNLKNRLHGWILRWVYWFHIAALSSTPTRRASQNKR